MGLGWSRPGALNFKGPLIKELTPPSPGLWGQPSTPVPSRCSHYGKLAATGPLMGAITVVIATNTYIFQRANLPRFPRSISPQYSSWAIVHSTSAGQKFSKG